MTARARVVGLVRIGIVGLIVALTCAAQAAAVPRLRSYRVGEHPHYDRVVWQFTGGTPSPHAWWVRTVRADGSGFPVHLEGRAFLQLTLTGVNWVPPNVPPEPTLTPRFAVLRQMKPAGVFEGVFTFGLGLSRRVHYRFSTLRHPDRLVLDLRR
jgi:hypothetical protein